ncbi:MAG: hypothetical protein AB7S26_10475 [Sandaracinaceae bacterium]
MGGHRTSIGRRAFVILVGPGVGGALIGCDGRIWTEPLYGSDAGRRGDGGPHVTLPPDEDGGGSADAGTSAPPIGQDAGPPTVGVDAGTTGGADAGCPGARTVTLHDTNAQALYFDGRYGPLTGVIHVDDIVAGRALELVFWHGHGGVDHRFTVGASDLAALARGERVMLTTTEVEGHSHMLFVDPVDERWRVSGASDRSVEVCG